MSYSGFYSEKANKQTMTWRPAGKAPEQVRFFELEFVTTGKGVSLQFVDSGVIDVADWSGAEQAIAKAVSSGDFPNAGPPYYDPNTGKGRKKALGISPAAPAAQPNGSSYGAAGKCLYVIKLADKNKKGAPTRQFSRSYAPFSLGDQQYPGAGPGASADLENVLSHASLISEVDGSLYQPRPAELGSGDAPYISTRWACFLFDYDYAKAHFGTEFAVRYNTHIEILDTLSDEFIPLMIDPDIPYPGGTFPGGGFGGG